MPGIRELLAQVDNSRDEIVALELALVRIHIMAFMQELLLEVV